MYEDKDTAVVLPLRWPRFNPRSVRSCGICGAQSCTDYIYIPCQFSFHEQVYNHYLSYHRSCIVSVLRAAVNNQLKKTNTRALRIYELFQGVYDWKDSKSAPYVWAFCVPSSCSAADVQTALHKSLSPLTIPGRVEAIVSVTPSDCHVADQTDTQFGAADIGIM
jgi:hypothetical protein